MAIKNISDLTIDSADYGCNPQQLSKLNFE